MKAASAALQAVLYGGQPFVLADLITIHFSAGVQRFTNSRSDMTIGADVYLSAHIDPVSVMQALGDRVAALQLTFRVSGQSVAGQGYLQAALAGLFDRVRVVVQRAAVVGASFAGYSSADLMTLFDGLVVRADPQPDGSLELEVADLLTALGEVPVSRRSIAAECPFTLGDADCGVALATWQHARTIAAGSTSAVVKLSSTSSHAVVGSVLEMTSGLWAGQRRQIRGVSGVDLTLDVPLPGLELGASVTVTRACDKTRATCLSVFANALRFGGFPQAPAGRT